MTLQPTSVTDARIARKIKDAGMITDVARQFAEEIAEKIGVKDINHQIIKRIKSPERMLEKANHNYDGNLDRIKDILGIKIIFTNKQQIKDLRKLVANQKKLLKEHPQILDVTCDDDFWRPKKHGFVGYKIQFFVPYDNRLVGCEIQLLHANMKLTDLRSHELLESERKVKALIKAGKAKPGDVYAIQKWRKGLRDEYVGDIARLDLWDLLDPNFLNPTPKFLEQLERDEPKDFPEYQNLIHDFKEARKEIAEMTAAAGPQVPRYHKKPGKVDILANTTTPKAKQEKSATTKHKRGGPRP